MNLTKKMNSKSDPTSLKNILKNFDPTQDRFISREFQAYGIYLTNQLDDPAHKSLYIKLAKETPRHLLEEALSFVKSANPRSKAKLFMWKLKQLKKEKNPPSQKK